MLDQQEMMEMMQKGKDTLKPYPFEKVMSNLAGLKQHEVYDGLDINIQAPFG